MTSATGRPLSGRSTWRLSKSLVKVGSALLVGACTASRPVAETGAPTRAPVRSAGFEQRLDEMAGQAERQNRLADEATALELLAILRPDDQALDSRRRALNERIGTATQDRLRRGADAFKRGLLDVAMSQYLVALALSPDNEAAANALRAIERERNRRSLLVKQRERTATPAPGTGD